MKIGKACLAVAAAAAMMTTAPRAGKAQVITFDEYGNIVITGFPFPFPAIPGTTVVPDPTTGLLTLSYFLPGVLPGDVWISEPGVPPGTCTATNRAQCSDLLRFINNRVFVFSDAPVGEPPEPGVLADGPFPPNVVGPALFLAETGAEGNNGLFGYTPGAGDPGFLPLPFPVTYSFISDGVVTPEPGSLLLTCTGGAMLGLFLRRRARAHRTAA